MRPAIPHTADAPLREIAPVILRIQAGAFPLEAANPRHEHEYPVWEGVKFPSGKIIIPGVMTHTTNCVEHPELVAERILRYARIVGRENVTAGVDCGFAQGLANGSRAPEHHVGEVSACSRRGRVWPALAQAP